LATLPSASLAVAVKVTVAPAAKLALFAGDAMLTDGAWFGFAAFANGIATRTATPHSRATLGLSSRRTQRQAQPATAPPVRNNAQTMRPPLASMSDAVLVPARSFTRRLLPAIATHPFFAGIRTRRFTAARTGI
jgi:hypothetical protein